MLPQSRLFPALLIAALCFIPRPAAAAEFMCDPSYQDCRTILLNYINNETIAIDVAMLFMEDDGLADAIIARHRAGVRVRALVEPRRNGETPYNAVILDKLANAGIPMRKKLSAGKLHWKFMIFNSQNVVQFSAANYSDYYFKPIVPYANYTDEGIFFTDDGSLVDSFRRNFDDAWIDEVAFGNYANISGTPLRAYPFYSVDPALSFVPFEDFATRSIPHYDAETQQIDTVMYKITEPRHADAIIRARKRGVPVRLIVEGERYRNASNLWQSYHVDRLYMAGVQIRDRAHEGFLHQKSTLLYGQRMTVFGSSNWTIESNQTQHEHNYFTDKIWFFDWFKDNFERKWTNRTGNVETRPFVPLPPDPPVYVSPAAGATGIATTGAALRWHPGTWSHLADIYFGTSSNPPLIATNVQVSPTETNTYTLPTLAAGTTYYWRIVSKTMALKEAAGAVQSFTTAGTTTNAVPSVTLTSPAHGTSYTAPATISLAASASDSDGTIARVDFYSEGTFLGSDSTSPYAFSWSGVPAGTYTLSARAIDNAGAVGTSGSATVTVTAPANVAPSVTLTSPASGASYTAPATISLAASASDSDGTIARVDFYSGSTLLGSDSTSPYAFSWSSVPAGSYTLSARAIDNAGAVATSASATVTVTAPPVESLPSPWQSQDIGAVGTAGSASASNGTFTVRGAGADVWGTADAFHYVWQRVSGDFDLSARVASVEYVHAWVKAGVMIRGALTADAPHAFMLVSAGKGLAFQRRASAGGLSTSTGTSGAAPAWAKLERRGNTVRALYSFDGSTWTALASDTVTLPTEVYVGLAVSSHDTTRTATADFNTVAVTAVTTTPPPTTSLPSPWQAQDIGAVGQAGSSSASNGTFTVKGAGADVWGSADAFHFAWQQISGDVDVVARVASVEYVHAWVKAGVMIRERLTADSPHAFMIVSAGKGFAFQRRLATSGLSTSTSGGAGTAPAWVKLERRGSTISAFVSLDGSNFTLVGSDTFTMGSGAYVGLAVSSHDTTRTATAVFDQVVVRAPTTATPPPDASEIVLHAIDAARLVGNWRLQADTTAASGQRAWNPDAGLAKITTASATPGDYIELTFNAEAGRAYRLWIRGKAERDEWSNDSVHVQFSGSVDAQGSAVYRIGSTSSAEYNLESCKGCGLAGWGWEDNGWGVNVLGPTIYFATTGTQTIRLQTREDGLSFDQIVLSSGTYLSSSPGSTKNDTTILPKR